ncbi:MAG: 1-acyl-sn-glycerol-3-phosphate acyltransferase [Clostridia bacterium]|nr:1-acyl-sn-glycerol-3-phosphate acyltransferase [Clostridia bacterium]
MKYICSTYLIISAALLLIINNFASVFGEAYSWWLVPVLLISFFIAFILLQMLVFFAAILLTNVDKPADRGAKFFRFMVKISLPVILTAALVKIDKKGMEKSLPEDTRMLFVCNHQHDFDPIIMLTVFPDSEIGFIGKKEIYETRPIVKRAMHRLHSLPIDRENDRETAKTIINAIRIIKEDKASIALFPEGYVSQSCELLPFRNGSLKIATKANVPIVVCAINNTRELPKRIFRRPTTVEFRFLDVIYPEQFQGMNTQQIGDIIHKEMEEALKEMRG